MFLLRKQAVFRNVYPSSLAVQRSFSHRATTPRRFGRLVSRRATALVGVGLGTIGASTFIADRVIQADASLAPYTSIESNSAPLGNLIRTYVVYSICSFPTFVDAAPKLLEVLMGIPIVRNITEALVRVTFFDQFVGGDTAQGSLPLLHSLRAENKGVLFAYSIEADQSEATSLSKKKGQPLYKRCVDEMVRSIDVAAEFEDSIVGKESHSGRRTWVAIKMTALVPDAESLVALSSHIVATRPQHNPPIPFPGCSRPEDLSILREREPASKFLNSEDIASLRELYANLRRICLRAQEKGVKLIIDAEYSWYQPAIDAMQLALMREFNKISSESDKPETSVQPLIYGTFQAYLRRTPLYLAQSYRDAQANNYALGVKLVRGAYHPHEISAYEAVQLPGHRLSISNEALPPVWVAKEETDKCYNECVKMLVNWIKEDAFPAQPVGWLAKKSSNDPRIGVLFGTHNWVSTKLILSELVRSGLAATTSMEDEEGNAVLRLDDETTERVTFGQLFGMSDALTNYIVQRTVSKTPMVIKYVPYGALSETMPYLSRRAIENKSVLGDGHAAEERKRAGREIWAKFFG
ncbi:FAD-linked oxidoreductase [Rhodocollybia butyracea]|uniref:Proline dehydrogenase n=1 Tax=Rhodocollybia butyracea TaxID=206335 RepID=A0A9P5Q5N5_9AGAR|nr:FAD-linked oxidoreductase [Rhodocollybia butyracea]